MSFCLNRVNQILSGFSKRKILVVGDVGLDKYTIGKVSRISPEAPIPVVEVSEIKHKLGLASNVADNIQALGGSPLLVGVIGRDAATRDFLALLKKSNITNKYVVIDPSRKTTLKERVVAEAQQVVRVDHETSKKIDDHIIEDLWEKIEKALSESDGVVIEDYAKGVVDASLCKQIVQVADKLGIPVLVDPNSMSELNTYNGCTILTPNTAEAETLSGIKIQNLSSLQKAGIKLLEKASAQVVVITRGKEGMAIFASGEKQPLLIPTFAREVFDVSGAGDTVIATLALSIVSGANIVEAVLLSNLAAGIEVSKRGTATVSREELKEQIEFLNSHDTRFLKDIKIDSHFAKSVAIAKGSEHKDHDLLI